MLQKETYGESALLFRRPVSPKRLDAAPIFFVSPAKRQPVFRKGCTMNIKSGLAGRREASDLIWAKAK